MKYAMNSTNHNAKIHRIARIARLTAAGKKITIIATELQTTVRYVKRFLANNRELFSAALQAAEAEIEKKRAETSARRLEAVKRHRALQAEKDSKRVALLAGKPFASDDCGDVRRQPVGADLARLLEQYRLSHDVTAETIAFYRRVLMVFEGWYGGPVPLEEFTADTVNHFLLVKQAGGRSCYYRRSLRSGLRALLNFAGKPAKLRPVKLVPLSPAVWTPDQVTRLIAAANTKIWKNRIALAYYSGLNQVDLERVEKRHIVDGVLKIRRSKTKKLVAVAIPQWLIDQLPDSGPVCPRTVSNEMWRREFRAIVAKVGLEGTFKTLRKTSGTFAELEHPGAGHMHLGNTRAVFELHYLDYEKGLVPLTIQPLLAEVCR